MYECLAVAPYAGDFLSSVGALSESAERDQKVCLNIVKISCVQLH